MISLDSPVESVLGVAKGKKAQSRHEGITERLGLRTVADLLRHFPRRYLETGSLSALDELREGQLLTVVGEIASSTSKTYKDRRTGRPAYRQEVVLRTEGPSLRMAFFAQKAHVSTWNQERLSKGRRGIFMGKVGRFSNDWQLTNPQMVLFGTGGDEDLAALSLESIGPLYPIYPLTRDVDSWDLQKAISFARTVVDELPELLPDEVRKQYDVLDARQALDWIHAPDTWGQIKRAQHRYRFEEALVTQLVLGRRRRAVRAMGARPRDGGDGGLLAAFDAQLPFELTRGPGRGRCPDRARPRPAAPDEPPAPGRGGLRQDPGRAAGDAARGRLRGPGRTARADRGARPAAPPLDHRDARRPGGRRDDGRDERRAAHRLDDQVPAHRAALPPGDRRVRDRDRHPRTAGGPGPVLRPRPGGGRRAAPVRRRAASRAHGQGRAPRPTCWS